MPALSGGSQAAGVEQLTPRRAYSLGLGATDRLALWTAAPRRGAAWTECGFTRQGSHSHRGCRSYYAQHVVFACVMADAAMLDRVIARDYQADTEGGG